MNKESIPIILDKKKGNIPDTKKWENVSNSSRDELYMKASTASEDNSPTNLERDNIASIS